MAARSDRSGEGPGPGGRATHQQAKLTVDAAGNRASAFQPPAVPLTRSCVQRAACTPLARAAGSRAESRRVETRAPAAPRGRWREGADCRRAGQAGLADAGEEADLRSWRPGAATTLAHPPPATGASATTAPSSRIRPATGSRRGPRTTSKKASRRPATRWPEAQPEGVPAAAPSAVRPRHPGARARAAAPRCGGDRVRSTRPGRRAPGVPAGRRQQRRRHGRPAGAAPATASDRSRCGVESACTVRIAGGRRAAAPRRRAARDLLRRAVLASSASAGGAQGEAAAAASGKDGAGCAPGPG